MTRVYPDINRDNSQEYVRPCSYKNCIGNIIWLTFVGVSIFLCFFM